MVKDFSRALPAFYSFERMNFARRSILTRIVPRVTLPKLTLKRHALRILAWGSSPHSETLVGRVAQNVLGGAYPCTARKGTAGDRRLLDQRNNHILP